MREIMIARRNGLVYGPNGRRMVRRGQTTAHSDHPVVLEHPKLWEPLKIDYQTEGDDGAETPAETPDGDNPPEGAGQGGAASEAPPEPVDNAAVREWAAANDIEVKRGKIPQAVIDQYRAAHGG